MQTGNQAASLVVLATGSVQGEARQTPVNIAGSFSIHAKARAECAALEFTRSRLSYLFMLQLHLSGGEGILLDRCGLEAPLDYLDIEFAMLAHSSFGFAGKTMLLMQWRVQQTGFRRTE